MSEIINFLSSVMGVLMDVFFQGLTLIGYPRLWACVVLYAIVTRLFFLPQKINTYRNKLLDPVIKRDLLAVDPNFFEKTSDKELTIKRAAIKKEVNKHYRIKNNSGCLTTLIQYPFLVALFYVVKNPQEFVPSLEAVSSVSPKVNTFFGISLSAVPLEHVSFDSWDCLVLLVPVIIVISNFIKMFPSLKMAKTPSQKVKVYGLFVLMVGLLGWLSTSLPIVISLYWLTNDMTYHVFDFFIHKYLPKNKGISEILQRYKEEQAEKAAAVSSEAVGGVVDPVTTVASDVVSENMEENEGTDYESDKNNQEFAV